MSIVLTETKAAEPKTPPSTEVATTGATAAEVPEAEELIARFATIFLLVDQDSEPHDVSRRLSKALNADPRVVALSDPEALDVDYCREFSVFPASEDVMSPDLLFGRDQRPSMSLSQPFGFRVRVPKKNQPTYYSIDEPASDEYVCVWDGRALVVGWTQPGGRPIPASGGQIVEDILADIAHAAGFGVYGQACSPGCRHVFSHVDMRVRVDLELTDPEFKQRPDGDVDVTLDVGDALVKPSSSFTSVVP
jgi:hypothetical protein